MQATDRASRSSVTMTTMFGGVAHRSTGSPSRSPPVAIAASRQLLCLWPRQSPSRIAACSRVLPARVRRQASRAPRGLSAAPGRRRRQPAGRPPEPVPALRRQPAARRGSEYLDLPSVRPKLSLNRIAARSSPLRSEATASVSDALAYGRGAGNWNRFDDVWGLLGALYAALQPAAPCSLANW